VCSQGEGHGPTAKRGNRIGQGRGRLTVIGGHLGAGIGQESGGRHP